MADFYFSSIYDIGDAKQALANAMQYWTVRGFTIIETNEFGFTATREKILAKLVRIEVSSSDTKLFLKYKFERFRQTLQGSEAEFLDSEIQQLRLYLEKGKFDNESLEAIFKKMTSESDLFRKIGWGILKVLPAIAIPLGVFLFIFIYKSVSDMNMLLPADRNVQVCLVPIENTPEILCVKLAEELRKETGLLVSSLTPLAIFPQDFGFNFNIERRQLAVNFLPKIIEDVANHTARSDKETLFIAIVSRDMYDRFSGEKYILDYFSSNKIQIIAADRIFVEAPSKFVFSMENHISGRFKKLIRRGIATSFEDWGKANPQFLEPIKSIQELDAFTKDKLNKPKIEEVKANP